MSISINVTPASSGGTFSVGSTSSQNVTLEVTGGIGPAGTDVALAAGTGISIVTVNNTATISSTAAAAAKLADLGDVSLGTPVVGQVLAYDGTAWVPTSDSALTLSTSAGADLGTAAIGTSGEAARADHVHNLPTFEEITKGTATVTGDLTLDASTGSVTLNGGTAGSASLTLNCEQNTHGITIKSPPHSAAATYTLTLPTSDGLANQVLTTDGSGVLSWSDNPEANVTPGSFSAIDGVSDFGASVGDLLFYRGTGWVPSGGAVTAPKDLATLLAADGSQNFFWSRQEFYAGDYEVEILPVGIQQNVAGQAPLSVDASGAIAMNLALDTATVTDFRLFASPTLSPVAYEQVEVEMGVLGGSYFLAEGIYLGNNFTAPGTFPMYAEFADASGTTVATTGVQNITLSQHGSPVAPAFISGSYSGTDLDVTVAVDIRPHALGFYPDSAVTLYAEVATDSAGSAGWTKSLGVLVSDIGEVGEISISNVPSGFSFVRTVAENPGGTGSYSEVFEVV